MHRRQKALHSPKGKLLTVPILAVRVELSPLIARSNVDLREVADTQDLNIVRGLYEVCAGDGTIGDEPCPVARLDAPCDLDTLSFSNSRAGAGLRRAVDTPVINAVDFDVRSVSPACFRIGKGHTIEVLAHRGLVVTTSTLVRARLALFRLVGSV